MSEEKTLDDKMKDLYKDICNQIEVYQQTCDELYSDFYDLQKRITKAIKLCEKQFIDYQVDCLGNKTKRYAPIDTNKIIRILKGENNDK